MEKYDSVDEYLADAPAPARPKLEELRALILATVPKAEEKIWYGVPFYEHHGKLVGFSVAAKHVSFGFEKADLADADRKALEAKGYKLGKQTLQIRFDQDLPAAAIKKIIKARVKANKAG